MLRLRDISEDTVLFPWNKSTPYPALEATLAVPLAMGLGELTGHRAAGSIAAGAAFTIGFAVFHEAMSSTLLSMALLTAGIASATLVGSLAAHWTLVVLALCVLAALNYGLLASLDPTASWIGQQCGVYVVISSYFAQGTRYAVGRASMVLAGGALQMVLFILFRFWHRYSHPGDPAPPPIPRQLKTRLLQLWRELAGGIRTRATDGYVLRLAITLGLSTALYRAFHWQNGYWAPMTAILVLKPQWANTLSRGIARLLGTLAGVTVTVLLVHLFPAFHHWGYFLLVAATAYGCFALQAVNYALFSLMLTLYTVFLFGFGGFSERNAANLRLINTAVGGLLALAVDLIGKLVAQRLDQVEGRSPTAAAG